MLIGKSSSNVYDDVVERLFKAGIEVEDEASADADVPELVLLCPGVFQNEALVHRLCTGTMIRLIRPTMSPTLECSAGKLKPRHQRATCVDQTLLQHRAAVHLLPSLCVAGARLRPLQQYVPEVACGDCTASGSSFEVPTAKLLVEPRTASAQSFLETFAGLVWSE